MEWFNSDERELDEFVASNNWLLPAASPQQNASPSPGVGSTTAQMDFSSPVSNDEFDISAMAAEAQRAGKGKAAEETADDDSGPKKYSPEETMLLAKIFTDVAEDPIIGNHQTGKVFWERIAQKYNAARPKGTFERGYVKLRKHWQRVQREMSKWNGKWANAVRMWPSGHSEMDLVAKANEDFYLDGKKHFKYYDVWKLTHKSPKYTGGAEPAESGAPKRTKVSASGNYSSSEGGPAIDLNVTDDDVFVSSPSTQSRPIGTKAAKRKAKGKAAESYPTMPPPPPNPSLDKMSDSMSQMSISLQMGHLKELTARDTSTMSEFDLELHHEMIAYLRAQMKK